METVVVRNCTSTISLPSREDARRETSVDQKFAQIGMADGRVSANLALDVNANAD